MLTFCCCIPVTFQAVFGSSLELTELQIQLNGGLISTDFDDTITHVIFSKTYDYNIPNANSVKTHNMSKGQPPWKVGQPVVVPKWPLFHNW